MVMERRVSKLEGAGLTLGERVSRPESALGKLRGEGRGRKQDGERQRFAATLAFW